MLNIDTNDNGILGRLPGELISAAMAQLPKPEEAPEKLATTTVQVPEVGSVRITCILRSEPRLKRRYWSVLRADIDA